MPIIYTYPSATPTANDLLIFSDVSNLDPNKATRKCTIGDLVALMPTVVPGGGTVTSVGLDFQTTGLTTGGAASQTITGAGSFDIAGTLVVGNGGTGVNSYDAANAGEILYYNNTASTTALQKLPLGTAGQVLAADHSGGAGAEQPKWNTLTAGAGMSIVTGVGSITFSSTGTTYIAGDGLDLSGTTFSTDLRSNGGLVINTAELQVDLAATDMANHLAVSDGGTGQTSYVDGQVLIGNTTGNTLNKATLTAGANITITNGGGSISIAAAALSGTGPTAFTPVLVTQGLNGGVAPAIIANVAYTTQVGNFYYIGKYVYIDFFLVFQHNLAGTLNITNTLGIGVNDGGIKGFTHLIPNLDTAITNNATVNISRAEAYTTYAVGEPPGSVSTSNWVMMPQSGTLGRYTDGTHKPFAWLCGHRYVGGGSTYLQTEYNPASWINLTHSGEAPSTYGILAGSISAIITS